MTLKEQLEKVEQEMKKNEEKRKDLLEMRKKLLGEIELETARNEAEKNRKVMDVITESFGEVTEENLELFRRIMREQTEAMARQKEQISREEMTERL